MSSRSISRWQRLKVAVESWRYPSTNYCSTCMILFAHGWGVSKSRLIASASSGCRYCIFILNVLKHFDVLDNVDISICWSKDTQTFYFQHIEWNRRCNIEVFTPAGYPPAWPGIPQKNDSHLDQIMNGSPQTQESYEFIRSCLRECDADHHECKIVAQELPTRLLDVQQRGAQQVRLVETKSLPARHRTTYIALSYCWGKGQSLTLRSENQEVMKSGIMISSLPQTLQDAITVTRALGQRYLWVDALCIIQDSPSDWEVESARMVSVYRGAYLTIAAATASDVTEGFLSRSYEEINTWYKEPYHEEWVNHRQRSTILAARYSDGMLGGLIGHGAPIPPWNVRGWTLQEQLISKRLLKYHAYELRWICQNKLVYQYQWESLDNPDDAMDQPMLELQSAGMAYQEWYRIVIDYSNRKLTEARDKLPAIAGLARVFQQVVQSPYIAGMWKDQLPWDLLWIASKEEARCAPELYVAPTFSWASISSPVRAFAKHKYSNGKWVSQTVVEDLCIVVDGKDPMGRVKDGWIRLSGYIYQATLLYRPENFKGYTHFVRSKHVDAMLYYDTWFEKSEVTTEHGNVETSIRRMRQSSSVSPHDNEHSWLRIPPTAVVYLFLVGQMIGRSCEVHRDEEKEQLERIYFLVLGLSSDKPGTYQRLGIVEYYLGRTSQEELDEFISGLLPAADGYKTITIV